MTRLKGAADQIQAYLATQAGEMPVARLEALVKAGDAGLSGVSQSIKRNRSTLRKLLAKFKTHFIVRNGVVRTAGATPAVPPPETAEQRRERMDRQFEVAQRLREEQDRQRDQRDQDRRQRLRDMRGVYDVRGRPA
jgi:hypothetical protein